MKKVANAAEPPVVIPIVIVAVNIHVTLVVVPLVEGGYYYTKRLPCHHPSK
jgi:hypothetical protein